MNKKSHKKRKGIVYSTDPDFNYQYEKKHEEETLPPGEQNLKIWLERKKGGKVTTVVRGFSGSSEKLSELSKILKKKCVTGGTAKNNEVIIQGDWRDKILNILLSEGYNAKKAGG